MIHPTNIMRTVRSIEVTLNRPPDAITSGQEISLTWSISGGARISHTDVHLDYDLVRLKSANALNSTVNQCSTPCSGPREFTSFLIAPAAGNWHLAAHAIVDSVERWSTVYAVTISSRSQFPDLVVGSLGISAGEAPAGSTVTITFSISNSGNASAPASLARIRIADATIITTADPLLLTVRVDGLAVSGSQSFSRTITVPTGHLSGAYYIGVTANEDATIMESDRSNNQLTLPFNVKAAPFSGDFQYPINGASWSINQDFEWNPTWGNGGAYHLAEDAVAAPGTAVVASADGVVRFAATDVAGFGGLILIEHNLGGEAVTTLYGHLSKRRSLLVQPGQAVRKGALIAYVADDDEDGGPWHPHLHFGVRKGAFSTSPICGHWPNVGYSQSCSGMTHDQYRQFWYRPTTFIVAHAGGLPPPISLKQPDLIVEAVAFNP
ncbi:MAG: hypothetical protein A3G41_08630, partial [Elusimicrobia bacterium RIFCSPLOWO2_12_FULL_59_9]